MRITIKVDSATPAEVFALTRAFQRSAKTNDLPVQVTREPTVTVAGQALGWVSPALYLPHAQDLLAKYADEQETDVGAALNRRLSKLSDELRKGVQS